MYHAFISSTCPHVHSHVVLHANKLVLFQTHTVIDCEAPPSPDNGHVGYSSTVFGSQASYSCNSGYELVGVQIRICQEDGWSVSTPTCVPQQGKHTHPTSGHVYSYIHLQYEYMCGKQACSHTCLCLNMTVDAHAVYSCWYT